MVRLLLVLFAVGLQLLGYTQPAFTVQKIWDKAGHNAFPDIRFYRGNFYMVFRESNMHVHETAADDGKIRVLISKDANTWNPFQLIEKNGYDLRDPMLEITSDGRLMLLMGGSVYHGNKLMGAINHVSFLNKTFITPQPVKYDSVLNSTHNWLWSITWHQGIGYGVIYQFEPGKGSKLLLATTRNGIDYSLKTTFRLPGSASESKVWFINNKKMMVVVRRDGTINKGYFGASKKPFTNWQFKDMDIQLGGPHLARVSKKYWVLSTRGFKENKICTTLFLLDKAGNTKKITDFPDCAGWDCSYPGMEVHNGNLYVSYYSSHEGKAKIYLATFPLKDLKKYIENLK